MRVRIRDVVAPVFWPVHRAIARGTVQELVAKGGRGSGKSSYISIELVLQLLRHPACHAVVLRKIGGTLRTSVYAQIQWAIGALGLAKQFRCTVSPMECTYLPTGQKILFFGTDDPGKLKSIKVPFGAIGLAWFEELAQLRPDAGGLKLLNARVKLPPRNTLCSTLRTSSGPSNWSSSSNQQMPIAPNGSFKLLSLPGSSVPKNKIFCPVGR